MSSALGTRENKNSGEVYTEAVARKGPDFVRLACDLLSKGVCPRCCLRYSRIGGKDAVKVYGRNPPQPPQMYSLMRNWGQDGFMTKAASKEAVHCASPVGTSDTQLIERGDCEIGGPQEEGLKGDGAKRENVTSNKHVQQQIDVQSGANSGPDGLPSFDAAAYPSGPLESSGQSDTDCQQVHIPSQMTCPLCVGILQHLSSGLQEGEKTSQDYWQKLPKVEADSNWKILPNASCQSFKAILDSSEHIYEEYGLDIQIPECVAIREVAMFRYLQDSFPSQYQNGKFDLGKWPAIGVKVAAKYSIIGILNRTSGCPCVESSSFRLCIRFDHEASILEVERLMSSARSGMKNRHGRSGGRFSKRKREPEDRTSEIVDHATWLYPSRLKEVIPVPPGPPIGSVKVHASMHQSKPLHIAGRYIKYDREISQTQFIIEGQRRGKTSVQEIIEKLVLGPLQADSLTLIAAGREDMDVRMLGTGRPFVLELQNPKSHHISRRLLESTQGLFDGSHGVVIRDLRVVGRDHVMRMKDGEKDKSKKYAAVVWISREVQQADVDKLNAIHELQICQATPLRVAHRRAALSRSKIIHDVKCEMVPGHTHYFVMWVRTSAGTYVKELIHGDMGRTEPSVASLLGCDAVCLQLDVTEVQMPEDHKLEHPKVMYVDEGSKKIHISDDT